MRNVQLLLDFHSTLHSSQSSRVRFVSQPAASTPANYINKKHEKLPSWDEGDDLCIKIVLCEPTFEKWTENCVYHLVTLMHHLPVTFLIKEDKHMVFKREKPWITSFVLCKWTQVNAHLAAEVLWHLDGSSCCWSKQPGTSLWFHHAMTLLVPNKHTRSLRGSKNVLHV